MPALQTCVGTISYPHTSTRLGPAPKGNAELVFSTVLLLDEKQMRSPAYTAFRKAVDDFAPASLHPKLVLGKGLVSPFRLCEEKENFPQEYKIFFNAWSKNAPGVVDNARNRVTPDSNEVWAGQHAAVCSCQPIRLGSTAARRAFLLGLQHVHGRS